MSTPQNTQLYENSPVKELFDDGERSGATTLFNQIEPNLAVQHEKPHHRQMVWMKARGASNREIAHTLGFTEPWVSQVLRQPWAVEYLLKEMRDAGVDELSAVFKGAAVDSAFKLIELRDDENAPKAIQRDCAIALLDRYMGKPVQKVEQEVTQVIDVTTVQKIDEQLAIVEQQEAALVGSRSNN